jgi:alpha-glucosidase
MPGERSWWRDGVIYQIYPRSFMDSNGDGVGDLEGIRRRLEHLAWLGVDGIWISPCFPSPMADFGYDVADYCDVDPLFGTLGDLDRMIADAHALGIRVLLDWVPNHTSDRHPWFLESRAARGAAKRDWYVWRDPAPGGGPPNNWISVFGGPAWELDPASGQYYLHSFLREQPDLNWRNPEVERAMHGVLRFWLDRGIDGFRIDVIHRIAKDPGLRDNPPSPQGGRGYGGQLHVHDEDHADVHRMLRAIRAVVDEYPERMLVGEIGLYDPVEVAKYYGRGDELHLGFNFSFLRCTWSAAEFRREVERFERALPPEGWPDAVLSNHDVPRHATRYDHAKLGEDRTRVAAMMLLTLRGTPFLYYGEEIGMRNVAIPDERLQDPIARTLHPRLSRDPERTPMQWADAPGAGFTSGEPWLPIGADAASRNVAAQRSDPASLLRLYRDLIALRRRTPALHAGDWRALDAPDDVLAFERRAGASRARVALNFSAEPRRIDLGEGSAAEILSTRVGRASPPRLASVELAPCEGLAVVLRAG